MTMAIGTNTEDNVDHLIIWDLRLLFYAHHSRASTMPKYLQVGIHVVERKSESQNEVVSMGTISI